MGPMICSGLGESIGWRWGFMAAAAGMFLGLVQFKLTRHKISEYGNRVEHPGQNVRREWLVFGAAMLLTVVFTVLCVAGVIHLDVMWLSKWTASVIVAIASLFFLWAFGFAGLNTEEKKRLGVIVVLFLASALFWAGFEQVGSSFSIFAERFTQRQFLGFEIPAGWFQSLNPLMVIGLAPLIAVMWVKLSKRNLAPSPLTSRTSSSSSATTSRRVIWAATARSSSRRRISTAWRRKARATRKATAARACARRHVRVDDRFAHRPLPDPREPRDRSPKARSRCPAGTITVAKILKDAGYATACMGKWGMGMFDTTGSPLKLGFDHFFGYNCQRHAHSYFPTYLYNDDQRFDLPGNTGKGIGKTYAQNLIADETLKFVRANQEKPFFLYYAITLPHGTFEIDDQGIYKDKPWTETQKNYAAMVTRLDSDVGRLLDLLKELGIDDKTLVMLAGDNGSSFDPKSEVGKLFDQASNGLRGYKRGLYEGALRQAALARWPGKVPAGRVSDEPWAFWDFLPTAAELAGATIPAECKTDGLSLVSFLKGGPAPKRDHFYWELHEGTSLQAVRFGDWKAVRQGPEKPIELYDLKTDAAGEANRPRCQQKPDLVAKAEALMKSSRTEDPDWPLVQSDRGSQRRRQRARLRNGNLRACQGRLQQGVAR
jgi:arylsulfatase A